LVAYSIAGVDARLAVNEFEIPIKSLTTISSPMNGFALGDYSNTKYSKTYEIEPIA
jgi:hypothetical protein